MQETEQLIEEMSDLTKKQKQLMQLALMNASTSQRRLGTICLLFGVIDILLGVINSKFSTLMLVSICVCAATALLNFYRAAKLANQAKEYKENENC